MVGRKKPTKFLKVSRPKPTLKQQCKVYINGDGLAQTGWQI